MQIAALGIFEEPLQDLVGAAYGELGMGVRTFSDEDITKRVKEYNKFLEKTGFPDKGNEIFVREAERRGIAGRGEGGRTRENTRRMDKRREIREAQKEE